MKNLIFFYSLLFPIFAFADQVAPTAPEPVQASTGYVSLGLGPMPVPLAILGLGCRMQSGHHGLDLCYS